MPRKGKSKGGSKRKSSSSKKKARKASGDSNNNKSNAAGREASNGASSSWADVAASKKKSKNQRRVYYYENNSDADETENMSVYERQMESLGLKIVQVAPDGNCMFASIAFQLSGCMGDHMDARLAVTAALRELENEYAPFIDLEQENDDDFEAYVARMSEDAVWGGQVELMIAARIFKCDIVIHRYQAERFVMSPGNVDDELFKGKDDDLNLLYANRYAGRLSQIHLSYHDGEHYNAIRLAEDIGNGPAIAFDIVSGRARAKAPCKKSKPMQKADAPEAENKTKNAEISNPFSSKESVDEVLQRAPACADSDYITNLLQRLKGDVDGAVDHIFECKEMGTVEWDVHAAAAAAGGGGDEGDGDEWKVVDSTSTRKSKSKKKKSRDGGRNRRRMRSSPENKKASLPPTKDFGALSV